MWFLKSSHDGSVFKFLLGKQYTVNRRGGDIVLEKDQSISRVHAVIDVTPDGGVYVTDEGSKYGTFVNEGIDQGVQLEANNKREVKAGDKIRFGLQWNIWQLCKTDIVVSSSTLKVDEKRKLQASLKKIGAKLISDWEDHCTYLVMNQVTLTRKVVCALASARPITTLDYWLKFEEAIANQTPPPDVKDFQPPITEEELLKNEDVSILPSEIRKSLFSGKVFVFSSEEVKNKNRAMVELAGGSCVSLEDPNITPQICCESNYIVISELAESNAPSPQLSFVLGALKKKRLKAMASSEIGMAIYVESTEEYCNPSFRRRNILQGTQAEPSLGVILAENTEDIPYSTQQLREADARKGIVIPPSLPSCPLRQSDTSRSGKRASSPSVTDDRPSKRRETEETDRQSRNNQTTSSQLKAKSDKRLDQTQLQRYPTDETDFTARQPSQSTSIFRDIPDLPLPKRKIKEEDEDVDPFKLPSPAPKRRYTQISDDGPSKSPPKASCRKTDKSVQNCVTDDDDDDPFKLPTRKQASKTNKSSKNRITDDDFGLPQARKSQISGNKADESFEDLFSDHENSGTRTKPTASATGPDRPGTSKQAMEESKKRTAKEQMPEGNQAKRRNEVVNLCSYVNGVNGKGAPKVTFADFLDKSIGQVVKQEKRDDSYSDTEAYEKELANVMSKIIIEETSLLRRRPQRQPTQDITNNSTTRDGRKNFKKFKKNQLCNRDRRIIDVVDDSLITDDPDQPSQVLSTLRSQESNSQSLEDLFPRIHRKNRRNEPSQENDDDWALPQ